MKMKASAYSLEPWLKGTMTLRISTSTRKSPSANTVSLRASHAANFATPPRTYGESYSQYPTFDKVEIRYAVASGPCADHNSTGMMWGGAS